MFASEQAADGALAVNELIDAAKRRFAVMRDALGADPDRDFAELCLSTHSAPSVCVYRRKPQTRDRILRLMEALSIDSELADFFWLLFHRIPAERHAVRSSLDEKLSVFFKTDLPRNGIYSLAAAIGLAGNVEHVVRYFFDRDRDPCGLAFEMSKTTKARLRLYDMIDPSEHGNPYLSMGRIAAIRELSGDCTAFPSVMNLSISEFGASTKLEAAGVRLGDQHRTVLTPVERELIGLSREVMSRSSTQRLRFFGLRFGNSDREISCYLDAFRVLR